MTEIDSCTALEARILNKGVNRLVPSEAMRRSLFRAFYLASGVPTIVRGPGLVHTSC